MSKPRENVPWYWWTDDEDFRNKCQDFDWRSRVCEILWDHYANTWDHVQIRRMKVNSLHLEMLGFNPDDVDEFAYREAVLAFHKEYSIPDSKIKLSPKEEDLFRWGVEMGLPLL